MTNLLEFTSANHSGNFVFLPTLNRCAVPKQAIKVIYARDE